MIFLLDDLRAFTARLSTYIWGTRVHEFSRQIIPGIEKSAAVSHVESYNLVCPSQRNRSDPKVPSVPPNSSHTVRSATQYYHPRLNYPISCIVNRSRSPCRRHNDDQLGHPFRLWGRLLAMARGAWKHGKVHRNDGLGRVDDQRCDRSLTTRRISDLS